MLANMVTNLNRLSTIADHIVHVLQCFLTDSQSGPEMAPTHEQLCGDVQVNRCILYNQFGVPARCTKLRLDD